MDDSFLLFFQIVTMIDKRTSEVQHNCDKYCCRQKLKEENIQTKTFATRVAMALKQKQITVN